MGNASIVQSAYDGFGRGDIGAVIDLLADDVEWVSPATLPQGGHFHGNACTATPQVDAQRVLERRILRVVEIHDRAVDGEPVVAEVGAAGHLGRRRHVRAHVMPLSGARRGTTRSASSRPWQRRRGTK